MPASRLLLPLLTAILLASSALSAESAVDPEIAHAEKALTNAKVGTDGPALLEFFRQRTLSDDDRRRLADTVKQLGDVSFAVREEASRKLVLAGHAAKPFLLSALKATDLEMRHRAENCLSVLNDNTELTLTANAARLLAARKPPGAVAVLLAYLPGVDEEYVEDAVLTALAAVGIRDQRADDLILTALDDSLAVKRNAAAFVLGQSARSYREPLSRRLTDSEPRVRYQAAAGLLRAGDKTGVPPLFALLETAPMPVAARAEDLLLRVATEHLPTAIPPLTDAESRRKSREAWETWWLTARDKVDLQKLQLDDAYLGFTVICEYDSSGKGNMGRIWECGLDGKQRWEMNVDRPMDVQVLPGGRFLIAENVGKVTERDREGKVLWEQKVASPVCCQRLANGNTFVASYTELHEFTRDGKTVFTTRQTRGGSIYYAQKLRTGNYLYILNSGVVVEVDPAGKEVRSFSAQAGANGAGYWASVEALSNGRFLLSLGSANQVVEIDNTGHVYWNCTVNMTTGSTRLRNGNTLAVSTEGRAVIEFDRNGKEVWRQATVGRPFRARRY